MPKRYASYSPADGEKIEDVERDRRLLPGEHEKLLWIIDGNFPESNQRGIMMNDRAAWHLLLILALETGMRLRGMYTLTTGQVDLSKKPYSLIKPKMATNGKFLCRR